jgi:hypothetical protein
VLYPLILEYGKESFEKVWSCLNPKVQKEIAASVKAHLQKSFDAGLIDVDDIASLDGRKASYFNSILIDALGQPEQGSAKKPNQNEGCYLKTLLHSSPATLWVFMCIEERRNYLNHNRDELTLLDLVKLDEILELDKILKLQKITNREQLPSVLHDWPSSHQIKSWIIKENASWVMKFRRWWNGV